MFIEDEELRFLYRDASQEHLDKLDAGMLRLEKNPEDTSPLQELLREAHSLKGDSRMLGVGDAETITHHVEDLLIAVDKGEMAVTSELCDRIFVGLDAIRKIAHEAVTDTPAGVIVSDVIQQLGGVEAVIPDMIGESIGEPIPPGDTSFLEAVPMEDPTIPNLHP